MNLKLWYNFIVMQKPIKEFNINAHQQTDISIKHKSLWFKWRRSQWPRIYDIYYVYYRQNHVNIVDLNATKNKPNMHE